MTNVQKAAIKLANTISICAEQLPSELTSLLIENLQDYNNAIKEALNGTPTR